MKGLETARKALFGETWALPLAVAVLVGGAEALRAVAPELWQDAGGPLLLMGAACVLVVLVRRGSRAA